MATENMETAPGTAAESDLDEDAKKVVTTHARRWLPHALQAAALIMAAGIAWGAVRLEPVWMEIGDAAGLAAGLAKKYGVTPAALDADLLVRALCEAGFLVSFFNDKQPLLPELQYFGTKGFFHDYNARLDEVLRAATAKVWAEGFAKLRAGRLDANALAQAVAIAEQAEPAAQGTCLTRGAVLRQMWMELNPKRTNP